jgi:protein-disulfide isomerase
MTRLNLAGLFGALALSLLAATPSASAQSFNGQEQTEIRAIVRDYLVNNPDVLEEALDALEARVTSERAVRIANDDRDFSIGPANAPITIVEFYDYRCPYCHAAEEWVTNVTRGRNDIRVVFKELPVLGPESLEAARAALAARPQGRYLQFHRALMGFRGDLTGPRIDELARGAGIDVPRMRRAMDSAAITDHLQDNHALAFDSGVTGTPGFFINGELIPGFKPEELDARIRAVSRTAQR